MLKLERGEAIKQKFSIIKTNPTPATTLTMPLVSVVNECCFQLPVFAQTSYTEDIKNDKFSVIDFWSDVFSSASHVLQKYESGTWVDKATISDNTYGTYYALGFYRTIYDENAIGFQMDFRKILLTLSTGSYRVKSIGNTIFSTTVTKYSFDFCLAEYSDNMSNYSVRLEWWLNGNLGNLEDDTRKRDFGTLNWYNSFRLPDSKFGYDTSDFEAKYVKYQTGKEVWLEDSQVEKYTLKTGRFDNDIHRFIKIDILQADEIRITDFNHENPVKHNKRYIIRDGGYAPNWIDGSQKASVEVKFKQAYQNLEHKRC